MKLKGKKVGVAFTGSFCTYEKAFEQLRRLKEEGAEIVTVFSGASQTTDSRDQPGGAHRAEKPSGPADPASLHRKYCGKAGERHYGLACTYGGKSASSQ